MSRAVLEAAAARALRRVEKRRGPLRSRCWVWPGARSGNGYGYVAVGGRAGRRMTVHALLYRVQVGPVRRGRRLHHRCENRLCVNPAHLEQVTPRQHAARHAPVGYCACGQPFDAVYGRARKRVHKACRAAYKRRRYALGYA